MSWDQLATAVLARRKELGLTQIGAAKAGDLSPDIIRNIENRRRTPKQVNPRTAAKIERALEWEPGSVVATVAGGKPTPIKAQRAKKPPNEQIANRDHPAPDTRADSPPPVPAQLDGGDRFALARQILALRSALSEHQRAISPDAREALMSEMANSAREAEEAIVRIMPWLDEGERGEAIQLLVKLREPLGENITGSN
ncbi:helix-turn-helix domain-containing protein (plasmid) [Mycolicibacterium crocinum]|uniref:Helix-turn-helix domain-containing protein n=1 Tax=Mycolicibacterium crocinum TaxID=388459 RepID=A0ABY3TZN6_9MYCO|nr:helix-turn-helix transcriptional regulator [Mycolicibacterium crocinum]ULN44710.1 helix-turn-helix domain-containing protein [Mycolicibacterium crocinum]